MRSTTLQEAAYSTAAGAPPLWRSARRGVLFTVACATLGAIAGHPLSGLVGACALLSAFAAGRAGTSDRVGKLRRLLEEALHDPLTGMATRAVAERALDILTQNRVKATVALADVDGLRAVNASRGHAVGDAYLAVVAARLQNAVPDGLVARLGGDEFVLISASLSPVDLASAAGAALRGPAIVAGQWMQPRASVGVAATHGGDARYALGCADAVMYTAKATSSPPMVYGPDHQGAPHPNGEGLIRRRRELSGANR
jgi:diguanylate cyclase (GGDEF)-like protein